MSGAVPPGLLVCTNFLSAILCAIAVSPAVAQNAGRTITVPRGTLCVTEGEIGVDAGGHLTVDSPKMRAYVNAFTSDALEAHFTYLGPTARESTLGSGAVRRQFGLKLRAQNACNLVYAMWRIGPESRVVVSIKRNPGETQSTECGNRGYLNVKPRHAEPVPRLELGTSHTLAATIAGDDLRVSVDGREVWEGDLGPEAEGLRGPPGIRSDNARLALDLKAGVPGGMHPQFRLACKAGPDVSD